MWGHSGPAGARAPPIRLGGDERYARHDGDAARTPARAPGRRRAVRGRSRADPGATGAARRHRHELARRQPGSVAPAGRRRRCMGRPGRRRGRPRATAGSRRRAPASQPSRHQALHEHRARAGAGRGRRDRRHLGTRRAGRRHRDERARAVGRLHREPPRRAHAGGPDRRRARSRPRTARPRAGGGQGGARRGQPGGRSAGAAARVRGSRPQPVDGRRGCAQGARDRVPRDPGALGRAASAWPVRGASGGRCARRVERRRPRRGPAAGGRPPGRDVRRPRPHDRGDVPVGAALGLPAHDGGAADRARVRREARHEPRLVRARPARPAEALAAIEL